MKEDTSKIDLTELLQSLNSLSDLENDETKTLTQTFIGIVTETNKLNKLIPQTNEVHGLISQTMANKDLDNSIKKNIEDFQKFFTDLRNDLEEVKNASKNFIDRTKEIEKNVKQINKVTSELNNLMKSSAEKFDDKLKTIPMFVKMIPPIAVIFLVAKLAFILHSNMPKIKENLQWDKDRKERNIDFLKSMNELKISSQGVNTRWAEHYLEQAKNRIKKANNPNKYSSYEEINASVTKLLDMTKAIDKKIQSKTKEIRNHERNRNKLQGKEETREAMIQNKTPLKKKYRNSFKNRIASEEKQLKTLKEEKESLENVSKIIDKIKGVIDVANDLEKSLKIELSGPTMGSAPSTGG